LVVVAMFPLFARVDKNFLPKDDESQFEVSLRAPEGASLEATRTVAESIARRVQSFPETSTTVVTLGNDPQRTKNLAAVYVKLVPTDRRKATQEDVMAHVRRDVLPAYARLDLRTQVSPVGVFSAGNNSVIQFYIGGPDLTELARYSRLMLAKLRAMPGVIDADSNLIVGKPELGVHID